MSRHGETMTFARWPLVLQHSDIRRMLVPKTQLLILSRALDQDAYEVHDAKVVRDNLRHKRRGMDELQQDPAVFLVEIADVDERRLLDLDLATLSLAGFEDFEDFYVEWLRRRRDLVLNLEVKLYTFEIVNALYLDQRVHRGYTRNPAHAVPDEPPVVDPAQLERYADDARERFETEHADEIAKRAAASRARRLKELQAIAVRQGIDIGGEVQAVDTVLELIESKLGAAA